MSTPPTRSQLRGIAKPTARSIAILDALRGAGPAEIRLLCPRGHLIAQVEVVVPQTDLFNPFILMTPKHNSPLGMHSDDGYHILVRCRRAKCSYKRKFTYDGLALDLGATVLARQAVHQLID